MHRHIHIIHRKDTHISTREQLRDYVNVKIYGLLITIYVVFKIVLVKEMSYNQATRFI